MVGIGGYSSENCVAKVMTRVLAGRLSKFSENHILTEGQGRLGLIRS